MFARIVMILCLICAMGPLSTDMYLPSIPAIAQDLATSVPTMQLTVSIFFLGMGIGQLVYGPLADAYGRKTVIQVGTAIFFITSLGSVFVSSVEFFLFLRFMQSLGAAAGVVVINAVMRDLFDGLEFVKAVSVTMLTINIAPLVAPTLGGLIAPLGWRLVFVILTIYAFSLFVIVKFTMKETLAEENRQSMQPGVIFKNYFEILSSGKSLGVIVAQMANGAGMFAFIAGSPYVYMTIYGVSSSYYGILFAANIICVALGTSLNTKLVKHSSPLRVLFGALLFSFTGALLLVISAHIHFESVFSIVLPVIMFICVIGIVGANATTYVLGLYREKSGTASAVMGSLRFAGGAFAGFVLNSFDTGNALPFAYTIFACSLISVSSFWISRIFYSGKSLKHSS